MSIIRFLDAWPVKSMRWVARFLSVPWAFWALFWTWFVSAHFSSAVSIIIMIIVAPMFMGAAIIASVWGKEALGGGVLLVDGVLMIASIIIVAYVTGSPRDFFRLPWLNALAFFTMVLHPLAAGSLFLECHRRSKTSGEQHV
ncbi:MAG: DUF7670 domain-containing protein [Candidatus Hodarchaeales archaeon]|jgi:hypothetical protein